MNPIKKIIFGEKTRGSLADGVIEVANIVATTAGAAGRNVSITMPYGAPKITKDGVTVAKAVTLEGIKGDGAKLLIQAADKTAKEAGDGTSACCILTREILKRGLEKIKHNVKPIYVKRGIDIAVEKVVEEIRKVSTPISSMTEISNIALISSNGDKNIAEIVTKAVTSVGENGTIMVENSSTDKNTVEIVEGLSFDCGYISPYFINNPEKQTCTLNKPLIFLYDQHLTNFKDMLPLMEECYRENRSLLIVCDDLDNDVLASLLQNHLKHTVTCCVVKAPMVGDYRTGFMEDVAALTGGTYFSKQLGVSLENIHIDMLGSASSVTISDTRTIIRQDPTDMTDDIKKNISDRIELLKNLIETTDSEYVKSTSEERLAKLSGGIAIVRIGGKTEAEVNEKKDRVDDAICATQSAREEGVVTGGGLTLYNISKVHAKDFEKLATEKDVILGIRILMESLEAQMKQIIENTGLKYKKVKQEIDKINQPNIGFEVLKGQITNLREEGIIDSAKVVRCALQNAASIAGAILTVNGIVTNDIDEMIRYNKLIS